MVASIRSPRNKAPSGSKVHHEKHKNIDVKNVVNDLKGDGIISAIDLFMDAKIVKGIHNEDRVVVTLNGKYLAYNEQTLETKTA